MALDIPGATHLHSGKVRDLYTLGDSTLGDSTLGDSTASGDTLLMVASDRISAYDHILTPGIPDKGEILTRMSLWWFDQMGDLIDNHVVSTDVPDQVAGRAFVVERLDMFAVECVARGYLAGSGLLDYRASGRVCGIALPDGLGDGSQLPEPIFTPATKADLGDHDENISYDQIAADIGAEHAAALRELTLQIYARAESIARDRGIILADTKLEFGLRADGTIVLADEVLTPDSSRFWPADSYEPGRAQPSYDKQFVRDWLTSTASGWDRSADVPPPELPAEIVAKTRERYVQAYEQLTGQVF